MISSESVFNPNKYASWQKFLHVCSGHILKQQEKANIKPLYVQAIALTFGWAHRVAHFRWGEVGFPLLRLLTMRSTAWWNSLTPLLRKNCRRDYEFRATYRHRGTGKLTKSWTDLIEDVVGHDWVSVMRSSPSLPPARKWGWVQTALKLLGMVKANSPMDNYIAAVPGSAGPRGVADQDYESKARAAEQTTLEEHFKGEWRQFICNYTHFWHQPRTFDVWSDNSSIASWASGTGSPLHSDGQLYTRHLFQIIEALFLDGYTQRFPCAAAVDWVPRALTASADLLCNICMDNTSSFIWEDAHLNPRVSGDISNNFRIICGGGIPWVELLSSCFSFQIWFPGGFWCFFSLLFGISFFSL